MAENNVLSESEIREIEAVMVHYAEKSAMSIEALKIVQQYRGWIDDEALAAIAEYLEIDAAQLESVATFYNLIYRQPVGRTVIHYCNSVSCWMLGAEKIRQRLCGHLKVELGEMSADGNYTVLPIVCLGACDHAPVALAGKELFLDLSEHNAVQKILEGAGHGGA